jgi:hypothetical protein
MSIAKDREPVNGQFLSQSLKNLCIVKKYGIIMGQGKKPV